MMELAQKSLKLSSVINELWKDQPGKFYSGEGSASFEKLEKPILRPKGTCLEVCYLL